jgi:thiamine-monophosphate kinase
MANRPGEFDLIKSLLAPLAKTFPGAMALTDDAAVFAPRAGHEVVVTKDAVVAGVHFLTTESPEAIAARALSVNLSDLAAMGATPTTYFMALMLPEELDADWLGRFTGQLAAQQEAYGIALAGGDTVSTPGPLAITITALGEVPAGTALIRGGACSGDDIYVSGCIGDATLGLALLKKDLAIADENDRRALIARHRTPMPRLRLGQSLRGLASAAIDVSDGLVADLEHICTASGVGAEVRLASIPLSPPARRLLTDGPAWFDKMLSGGDDYELIFSAPPASAGDISNAAREADVAISRIGQITERRELRWIDENGQPRIFASGGWKHF